MSDADDERMKDEAARILGEKAAQSVRDIDHPLLSSYHVDGLRESLRQVNWAARMLDRTMSKMVTAVDRLARELELARLGPHPGTVHDPER